MLSEYELEAITRDLPLSAEVSKEFDELNDAADEEEYLHPTTRTVLRAKFVAYIVNGIFPGWVSVYPTPEGDIGIQPCIKKGVLGIFVNSGKGDITCHFSDGDSHSEFLQMDGAFPSVAFLKLCRELKDG